HPAVWGLALWAGVHALANGNQASLILFGLLGILGLLGPASLDAKRRGALGAEAFARMKADVARTAIPAALVQTGLWRIAGGFILYAALMAGHDWVIGVAPLGG
ncbi:MAG: NnrU family protein, partial [Rhodospirillales bacterium]|nr:NnrU family protein [Rhodospirillales bacterium]